MKAHILLACAAALLAACGSAEPQAAPAADNDTQQSPSITEEAARLAALEARGVRELDWEELLPEGEEERLAELYVQQQTLLYSSPIAEGSAADQAYQIGTFNTVPELDGQKIRLPGYTVPFVYGRDAEITSFLLVPYFGACIHSPPPPPNQTIYVTTETPIKLRDLEQAVWIEGTLIAQTENTELADAAYTVVLDKIENYEY